MLLTALVLGFYASRRIQFQSEDGGSFLTVNHEQIWADLIGMFALIGTVCGQFVSFSRSARGYFNAEIQPWLSRRGFDVQLPTIDLPRLPGTRSETVTQ